MSRIASFLIGFFLCTRAIAQDMPTSLPRIDFHLTAQPWQPTGIVPTDYLKSIEGMCRIAQQFQDEHGAIIDPFLLREHQYSTPYYAHAVATLLATNTALDLLPSGLKAMEHATQCFANGYERIPDAHGEFFISPLTEALDLYQHLVDKPTYELWRDRMSTPLHRILSNMHGRLNNWRTYAMKGEWQRGQKGLIPVDSAIMFIERGWLRGTQRERILLDKWNLYQDWSSDPQSHAVEAVGRGNLVSLHSGHYTGPSSKEIEEIVRRGSRTSLLLQSPSGQCPPNGRTDNHVFNDILYMAIFHAMSRDALSLGDRRLAGQYVRAANLAFQSIQRWRRHDANWDGSFYITKNHFDPAERIGYQPASQWGNYSGAMMFHLAEAYHAALTSVEEKPSTVEIGGYALTTDAAFSTFVANAGGMQIFVNLRGASVPKYGLSWTPLGVVRFSKSGWDDRLGPSDGQHIPASKVEQHEKGLTFGPIWREGAKWIHLADRPKDYRITPTVHFVHPLLVRFSLSYHYVTGSGGPYFKQDFTVTPDGILTKLYALQPTDFGLSVPLLVNDGRPLEIEIGHGIASVFHEKDHDHQNFIGLNSNVEISLSEDSLQSTYGWLRSANFLSTSDTILHFIYPQKMGEKPSAEAVQKSFRCDGDDFSSMLHVIKQNLYLGRDAAGGEGDRLDLNQDGTTDLQFDGWCRFMVQLEGDQVMAVEVDRSVTLHYRGEEFRLLAYNPVMIRD